MLHLIGTIIVIALIASEIDKYIKKTVRDAAYEKEAADKRRAEQTETFRDALAYRRKYAPDLFKDCKTHDEMRAAYLRHSRENPQNWDY